MREQVDYATVEIVNEKLDELSHRHFSSVDAIETVMHSIFTDHGIHFPGGLSVDEDTIYKIEGEDDLFLYVIIDEEPVGYSMFAQILEEDDIYDIQDEISEPEEYSGTSDFLRRVRRSADD